MTLLFAKIEDDFQRVVDELYSVVNTRRKLKMNVFERRKVEVVYLNAPCRQSVPEIRKCEVVLGKKTEEKKEFKYLGTMLSEHGRWEEK